MNIGLRELRQNASEFVRRAEGGETFTVTVSGRPAARLGPPVPATWRRIEDVADLWDGHGDPGWAHDRDLVDQTVDDPWERR